MSKNKFIFISQISAFLAITFLLFQCTRRPGIQITAHRGASGIAPENTMASIRKAVSAQADFAEIDVQETADGHIILLHDDTIDRTTDGSGPIWQISLDRLANFDAGAWFGTQFTGEKIPQLESVIDSLGEDIKLNIELKINDHEDKLAQGVAKILNDKNFKNRCIVTSFNFETIQQIQFLDHRIRTGYILGSVPDSLDVFSAPVKILSIHKHLATAEFIRKAHALDKEVHVWTVNDSTEMQRLIDLKVDNIITNLPGKLHQVLLARKARK